MSLLTGREFAEPLQLDEILRRTLIGFKQDDGYWHTSVALQTDGEDCIVFTTVEHSAGHWFEVFPVRFERSPSTTGRLKEFPAPVAIVSATPLWRAEWIEEGAVGPTIGAHPKTQYAGRGPIPAAATSFARVLAGVLMHGSIGERILVASSDSAPFNVEIAFADDEIDNLLEGFEPIPIP